MEVDLFIVRNANSGNQGDRLIYLSGLNYRWLITSVEQHLTMQANVM